MNRSIRIRLFVMMVLEFVIWGCWLPLIYSYLPSLGFSASAPPKLIAAYVPGFLSVLFSEQALILNAFPAAAIVGLFFSNQFADRHFAAEKFLAFSHFVGGLAILSLGFTRSFWPFFLLMLVHCLLYVPTNSICNSIAFANLKDPQKEFGIVRMGGSIGWVLAAWPFTFIFVDWAKVHAAQPAGMLSWLELALGSGLSGDALREATRWTYIVAGITSLALCLFSFTLPHTPPRKASEGAPEKLAWLEALRLLKQPFVLVLWLVTFVDAVVLYSYFNWTGTFLGAPVSAGGAGIPGNWIMPVMSIGQVAEILTMYILGVTLKKLGWRVTMIVGILGHVLRFGVYAYFPQATWMIVVVQLIHGVCYAFFFATVYIFADTYFPKDVRASAQGLFNVMILGVGSLVANTACPWLIQAVYTTGGVTHYKSLFLLPCFIALGAAVALALFFHPPPAPATAAASGQTPAR